MDAKDLRHIETQQRGGFAILIFAPRTNDCIGIISVCYTSVRMNELIGNVNAKSTTRIYSAAFAPYSSDPVEVVASIVTEQCESHDEAMKWARKWLNDNDIRNKLRDAAIKYVKSAHPSYPSLIKTSSNKNVLVLPVHMTSSNENEAQTMAYG